MSDKLHSLRQLAAQQMAGSEHAAELPHLEQNIGCSSQNPDILRPDEPPVDVGDRCLRGPGSLGISFEFQVDSHHWNDTQTLHTQPLELRGPTEDARPSETDGSMSAGDAHVDSLREGSDPFEKIEQQVADAERYVRQLSEIRPDGTVMRPLNALAPPLAASVPVAETTEPTAEPEPRCDDEWPADETYPLRNACVDDESPMDAATQPPKIRASDDHPDTLTAFEQRIRELMLDPSQNQQFVELYAKIRGTDAKPGTSVLLSVQADAHASDVLGGLAMLHALGSQKPVLLIDADVENRFLTSRCRSAEHLGVPDVVAHGNDLQPFVLPTAITRLFVLPVGNRSCSFEAAERIASLISDLQSDYDWILVDGGRASSPLGIAMAHVCRRVLLHIQLGRTSRQLAEQVLTSLRSLDLPIHGTIVTSGGQYPRPVAS